MTIYIITFLVSVFFAKLCDISQIKYLKIFFAFIAIIIPSLLAGVRDPGIGNDTLLYVDLTFDEVYQYKDLGILPFIKVAFEGNFTQEPFYCILNYIGIQCGTDVHWVYFVVSFFTISMVFLAIYYYRKEASLPLMFFVYLFLFFNISLNTIRQSVSMALALCVFVFLRDGRLIIALLCFLLLIFSHTTSVVFLLFIILYFAVLMEKSKRFIVAIVLTIPTVLFFLDDIILLAISLSIVPTRFVSYMISEGNTTIFKTALAYGWLSFILILFWGKHIENMYKKDYIFILYVKLFANLLLMSSIVTAWAFRMSYYFVVFDVLFIPRIIRLVSRRNQRKGEWLAISFLLLILFYWYWSIIHNNENETYPYKSKYLGL